MGQPVQVQLLLSPPIYMKKGFKPFFLSFIYPYNIHMLFYGNYIHIGSILILIGIFTGLYFLFRNKSDKAKKILILVIMFLNLFQHLFKFIVWPHLYHETFGLRNTAYNFCALMIMVAPFFFLTNLRGTKSFLAIMGTVAGFIAVCVPFWFNGVDVFKFPDSSEYARFYTCHSLLFIASALEIAFGFVSFKWKDFYKVGLFVLAGLTIILLNNLIVSSIVKGSFEEGVNYVMKENSVFMIGPKYGSGFEWFMDFLVAICPPFFKINGLLGFIPILWYAIPLYIVFSIGAFIIYTLLDKNSFVYNRKEGKKHA